MFDSLPPDLISTTTVFSFLLVLVLLVAAYAISAFHLPKDATTKTRIIYIWHLFDSLIHVVFEGSFLYYSFFSSQATNPHDPTNHGRSIPMLWGDRSKLYGAFYAPETATLAGLWKEYGKADIRWGNADVGVLTLELLTVLAGGPLAAWICVQVARGEPRRWFWITVLATAELYGGWMTFAPEWISGNENLVTENWMYKWVYLFFFNTLWVWIPLWLLWEAYGEMVAGVALKQGIEKTEKAIKKAK
ncbi:Emopamil-binding protein [Ascobolus immersus RN42]|uniref:Emopamil-binding protein n=1 Tax=Ascobolus immersus RN42 TaxID=1160509 RepID=A0A3N4IJ60_ASCIM|nr:Emopamil-binding protein [Ascobolus immersus RN42]